MERRDRVLLQAVTEIWKSGLSQGIWKISEGMVK